MTESETPQEERTIPFFPDHLLTEARVAVVILFIIAGIGIYALHSPVGLGDPADPMNTPEHTKPEWYFLFLYEILKYVPKSTGAILPFIAVFVLTFWPFFDRKSDNQRARQFRIVLATILVVAVIVLSLLGELS